MKQSKGLFIVWKEYQRRVEVLAPLLELDIYYFYYSWESRSKFFKALSYILKSINTLICLFQHKPRVVFVQFPPPPALYCAAFYSWLTGAKYVSDCHIGITNANWLNWVYVKKLLARGQMIVHNEHLVSQVQADLSINPQVVRDGVFKKTTSASKRDNLLEKLGLSPKSYVIVPCSFSPDEPITEVIEAAKLLPAINFALTWYPEKLSKTIRDSLPSNIILTGYLQVEAFNQLFANSGVALVLTEHDAVQLSGMQEAMAFEIPAVVSDKKTTRFLYKAYPVFVENNASSISKGIAHAFQDRIQLEENMKRLRTETESEFFSQIVSLKSALNS